MDPFKSTGQESQSKDNQSIGQASPNIDDSDIKYREEKESYLRARRKYLLRLMLDPTGLAMLAVGIGLLLSHDIALFVINLIPSGYVRDSSVGDVRLFVAALLILGYYVRVMRAYLSERVPAGSDSARYYSGPDAHSKEEENSYEDQEENIAQKLNITNQNKTDTPPIDEEKLTENIILNINKKLQTQATKYRHIKNYQSRYLRLRSQISGEMQNLQKRSINNLLIGSAFSVIGMIILGIFVINSDLSESISTPDPTTASIDFFKRISVVIVIEIFGYFFLRLYRGNLEDIKYYQNEITNIDSRIIAIESCNAFDAKTSLNHILKNMGDTERNFRLKKGETTVNLREREYTNAEMKGLISDLKNTLANAKKN